MKLTIILSVFILITIQGNAQQNTLHKVDQINGTGASLSEWFGEKAIPKGDLYAVLLPLGNCPRCEGAIVPFFKDISLMSDKNLLTLLIVVYPYQLAALEYLKSKNYGASKIIILDPQDEFFNSLRFSTNGVQVPYIMKFNTANGVLIKSDALLGLQYNKDIAEAYLQTNEVNTESFIAEEKPKSTEFAHAPVEFKATFSEYPNVHYEPEIILNFRQFLIDQSDFVLSDIMNISVSNDIQYLTIDDHLTSKSIHYTLKDSVYEAIGSIPDSNFNNRLFIDNDIPSLLIDYLEATNVLHTMFLKTILYNNKVFCSASLPHLFYENRITESIGYMNKPVIVHRAMGIDFDNIEWSEVIFDENAMNMAKGFSHSNFFIIGDSLYLPVKTGWPATGTGESPESESDNTFKEAFYQHAPAMNLFDLSGNFISNIGSLPNWHKEHRTGYSFFEPILKKSSNHNYYLADSYIGEIYTLSPQMNEYSQVTTIFESITFPEDSVKTLDASLEYFAVLGTALNKRVIDFSVSEDLVYSILLDGSHYYISESIIGTNNSKLKCIFPLTYDSFTITPIRIDQDSTGEIMIISIMRNDESVYLGVSKM